MKLIFCLDDNQGMMFYGRRQSQDRILRQWILEKAKESGLWMSCYSAKQFKEDTGIIADDNYGPKTAQDDYCFLEDMPFEIGNADEVILCHWNRKYQADKHFDVNLRKFGFRKACSEDIKGSSHERITIDTYRRDDNEKK